METLPISLKYENLLLGPPLEWNPRLYIWAPILAKSGWSMELPIVFEDKENSSHSIVHKIEIPVEDPTLLNGASRIGFQLRADTLSETGVLTSMEVANCMLPFEHIYNDLIASKSEKFEKELEFSVKGYNDKIDDEITQSKGKIKISISGNELGSLTKCKLSPLDPYQQIVLNPKLSMESLNFIATKAMAPFVNNALKGTLKETEDVNVPVFMSEIDLIPAKTFWLNDHGLKIDEKALQHLVELELDNAGMSQERFSEIVDNQFDSNSSIISKEFFDVLQIYAKILCSTSLSVQYLSDQIFAKDFKRSNPPKQIKPNEDSHESNNKEKKKKKKKTGDGEKKKSYSFSMKDLSDLHEKYAFGAEFFRDPMSLGSKVSGDCEDDVKIILKLSNLLEKGDEKYKSDQHPWTANGGFKSKILSQIQKIAFLYVPLAVIGTVAGRYPGDESNNSMSEQEIKINSEKFLNAEVGGHAMGILCPLADFEKMITKISDHDERFHLDKIMKIRNNIKNRNIQLKELDELIKHNQGASRESSRIFFKDWKMPEWCHTMPVLLGEGTGFVSPLYIPPMDAWETVLRSTSEPEKHLEQVRENAKLSEEHRKRCIDAGNRLGVSKYFELATTEVHPKIEKDTKDLVIGSFYRFLARGYTNKFWKYGIPVDEIAFIENGPVDRASVYRSSEISIGEKPKSVVKAPEELLEKGWSYGVHIKDLFFKRDWVNVLLLPAMSEDEKQIARITMEMLPPLKTFEYGENTETEKLFRPLIDELNEECKKKYGSFKKELNKDEFLHTFYYEKDYFLNEELRDNITESFFENPFIKNLKFHIDHLTNNISRLRIKALVDMSDDSSNKKKRYKLKGISSNPMKRVHILPRINYTTGTVEHISLHFDEEEDHKSFIMGLLESQPQRELINREKRFYSIGKEFSGIKSLIQRSIEWKSKRKMIQKSF